MEKPFEVGQRVVCIRRAHWRDMEVGQVFTVKSMEQFPCGCWAVNVGHEENGEMCSKHLTYVDNPIGRGAHLFAPYKSSSICNSVTKELAEKAMNVGDTVEQYELVN